MHEQTDFIALPWWTGIRRFLPGRYGGSAVVRPPASPGSPCRLLPPGVYILSCAQSLLLFTLGAGICAAAPNLTVMALGRAVVGFGLGGEVAIAVTMLAEFCSTRFRGTAVGLVNVGAGGLGNFLAPGFGLLVFMLFPGDNAWRLLT